LGNAVRREDHRLPGIGDLVELLDEDGALLLQSLDHMPIVDDFMAHIDRRAVALEGERDDMDRALDAGAEAARAAEHDIEQRFGRHRSAKKLMTLRVRPSPRATRAIVELLDFDRG